MEIVAALALAVAALAMGYAWWSRPPHGARREIIPAVNTPIAGIKQGERIRVTGTVSALAPLLTSPVGEHDCIGFRLDVERVDGAYPTVFERQACGAFSIADGTGEIHVDGPFLLGLPARGHLSTMRPRLLELLAAAGVPRLELPSYRGFAFREALLCAGDQVSVVGRAFLEPDPAVPAAGHRVLSVALRLSGSNGEPVVIVDDQAPVFVKR
jgi:hypothetical protein